MILSDKQILEQLGTNIKIEPFRRECLGSNSYDVHLGGTIGMYEGTVFAPMISAWEPTRSNGTILDSKKEHKLHTYEIPEHGWTLFPGILYLGVTMEYTETHGFVPWLDGKSSIGRLGISIHATAGRGDAGFCNHWTLELSCIQPVHVYKGMPIGQITYFHTGPIETPYNTKQGSAYAGVASGPVPVASRMWKNFDPEKGQWK